MTSTIYIKEKIQSSEVTDMIRRGDSLTSISKQLLIPYQTLKFHIYKCPATFSKFKVAKAIREKHLYYEYLENELSLRYLADKYLLDLDELETQFKRTLLKIK